MQRSGYDEKNLLKYLFFIFLLFIYEPLSTIYLFLPPLFGLMLWLIFANGAIEEKIFALSYLYLYEIDHGMQRFSLFVTLFLSIYFLRHLRYIISSKILLQVLGVAIFYGVLVGVMLVYGFIMKESVYFEASLMLLYASMDLFVVVAYEK